MNNKYRFEDAYGGCTACKGTDTCTVRIQEFCSKDQNRGFSPLHVMQLFKLVPDLNTSQ